MIYNADNNFDFSNFQKPNRGMGDSVIKYYMIFLLTISIPAVSTNNRVMLGVFLAGSALAASLCKYLLHLLLFFVIYEFSYHSKFILQTKHIFCFNIEDVVRTYTFNIPVVHSHSQSLLEPMSGIYPPIFFKIRIHKHVVFYELWL